MSDQRFTTQDIVTLRVKGAMLFRRELQSDIAAVLGIHPSGVTARFNGRRGWTLDEVDMLAEHFGCQAVDLLTDGAGFLDRITIPQQLPKVAAKHFEAIEDPIYLELREARLARRRAKARGGVQGLSDTRQ